MKTFSRPVSSGWKPVPTSRRLATRPLSLITPCVGAVTLERIFRSVDFPAPLRPMTPTVSPRLISMLTSSRARNRSFPEVPAGCCEPTFALGSSFPLFRAHQLCRSLYSIPWPMVPRRYSFDTPSILIASWLMGYQTVSINVFSTRLKSMRLRINTTTVTARLIPRWSSRTEPAPRKA